MTVQGIECIDSEFHEYLTKCAGHELNSIHDKSSHLDFFFLLASQKNVCCVKDSIIVKREKKITKTRAAAHLSVCYFVFVSQKKLDLIAKNRIITEKYEIAGVSLMVNDGIISVNRFKCGQ